jgi:peptidoglycan/xylan/chitin deacetylase (PgdA/CDA1 family)
MVRALRPLHDRSHATLTILAYHRVMPIDALEAYPFDDQLISATPAQFDWQMRYLREHLNPVALSDLIAYLDEGAPLPPAAVAVTFDDGFADTYRYAFPVLKRYAIPATVFVSTGYVDSREPFWFELAAYLVYRLDPHALCVPGGPSFPAGDSREARTRSLRQLHGILKDLPNAERLALITDWTHRFADRIAHDAAGHSQPISWLQVQEMAGSGIEFGSHTVTHPNLTCISNQDLETELRTSKQTLEDKLQRAVASIAYPIGTPSTFNTDVIEAIERHGYKLGLTYLAGANALQMIDRFRLNRHGVGLCMTLPYFRAVTSLPYWLH